MTAGHSASRSAIHLRAAETDPPDAVRSGPPLGTYYWAMVRNVRPHLRFVLIWSAVAVIAAAALLLARLPLFIVLLAIVWAAVLIGALDW